MGAAVFKTNTSGVPAVAQRLKSPTGILNPWLSGLRIRHCCELCVGPRCGLDPAWLWLWRRPAAAAPIQPLAWELSYATGEALKKKDPPKKGTLQMYIQLLET